MWCLLSIFQADGWIVDHISLLANPNQVRPTRFWGVYTKLKIFNMTKYKKGIGLCYQQFLLSCLTPSVDYLYTFNQHSNQPLVYIHI